MGQLIDLASYRKQPMLTPTPALPAVGFSGSDVQLRGTYHVDVFREGVGSGRHTFVLEAFDAGVTKRIECLDVKTLKGALQLCRTVSASRHLLLRVRNNSGLPPKEALGLEPHELMH